MIVRAPIDKFTHRVLRAAVLELRESTPPRRFGPRLHVGLPGDAAVHDCLPGVEREVGFHRDLALVMLDEAMRRGGPHLCWLSRPGDPVPHDLDAFWQAAVDWAAQALQTPVELVVVTRSGWYAPRGEVVRTWRRLRRHSPDPHWASVRSRR